jgi:transcriptional regulator with XRE-family HTH domain
MRTVDPFLKALGRRIARLRHEADLSQEQLAERAGLSIKAVSEMERGAVNPSVLILRSLARGLGVALPRVVAEPGATDLEIAALLHGKGKADQARALALVRVLFTAPDDLA